MPDKILMRFRGGVADGQIKEYDVQFKPVRGDTYVVWAVGGKHYYRFAGQDSDGFLVYFPREEML